MVWYSHLFQNFPQFIVIHTVKVWILFLIDRVPDELWNEFVTLYRRQGSRPSPWKRNAKKQNGCLGEALQIAVKRREAKNKGKRKDIHLNAEFQRIARRDKKAFLSDQCEEIEEKNRMGKTRDLFEKIRDTKRTGTFHAKMGSIKDRNDLDLTAAGDIKKRWQEYCTKKIFTTQIITMV